MAGGGALMAFTYGGDPTNSNRDAVRLMIQDTSTGPQELSDNEVDWLIASHPDNWFAAAAGAKLKAGKFSSGSGTKWVGDLKIEASQQTQEFRSLASELLMTALRRGVKPAVGGISISQKETDLSDTDWDQPNFKMGQNDFDSNSTGRF